MHGWCYDLSQSSFCYFVCLLCFYLFLIKKKAKILKNIKTVCVCVCILVLMYFGWPLTTKQLSNVSFVALLSDLVDLVDLLPFIS